MKDIPLSCSGKPAMAVARELVLEAGALLKSRFHTKLRVTNKGRANIVTDVDVEAERLITARLRDEFPAFGILAEESGRGGASSADYTWVIDPLDGTRNYAMGVPHYAVTLALASGNDIFLGLTYDPMRNELFSAEKGRGAFVDGRRVRVSSRATIEDSVLGTDLGYSDALAGYALQLVNKLWPGMQGVRIMGSAALGIAYAASGRVDMYFHHALSPWDIAAGVLMAQEAGGIVTDRHGKPITLKSPSIVVSNPALHAEFLRRTEGLPWRTAKG